MSVPLRAAAAQAQRLGQGDLSAQATAYERATGHGAAPVLGPTAKPWGQTVSYVRDPDGFEIELTEQKDGRV